MANLSKVVASEENPLLMPLDEATPQAENSLLLPDEGDKEQAGNESQPISHILACGCGGLFEGTKHLKAHTKENPRCLDFWGGSYKCLSQQVRKEFNRRRSLRWYYRNQGLVQEQKREEYWANPVKERDRKRVAYNIDKEKERDRKRSKNEAQAEKERVRQSEIRALHAEIQNTLRDRETFEKEGRYGPIFPCVSCQQLNWYTGVSIEDLDKLPADFVDIQHVYENMCLFRKQNRFFLCRPCKKDLEEARCPRLSTRNYLQCPWLDVPSRLLSLNLVRLIHNLFYFYKYSNVPG